MNIYEQHNSLPSEEENTRSDAAAENIKADAADELIMYDPVPETDIRVQDGDNNKVTVGLIGGQGKDDEGGLDMSQYTGPNSKPSNEFNDPNAPYHTGPGNSQGNDEIDTDE